MKKKLTFILILFATLFISCNKNILDTQIQQNYDEELFLNSGSANLKAFGMGVYNYLPQLNRFSSNGLLAAASDEADFALSTAIQKFNTGAWGPYSNPDDVFGNYYKAIRSANLFLDKTVDFKKLLVQDTISNKAGYVIDVDDFTKLRAEVRFLRAYFYMELVKRYGGVPIVTTVLNVDNAFAIPRNTYDECINFIVTECDACYPDLTNHYVNYGIPVGTTVGRGDGGTDNNKLGRVEKPAAVALKVRALLYAASSLNNPANSLEKWQLAASAAQQLFNDPNCVQVKFLYTAYKDLFEAQNTTNNLTPRKGANSGLILTRPFQQNGNSFEVANYPVGMTNGGGGVTSPSQNLVDAFEVKSTGKPITEPTSNYNAANPFNDRDPRLAQVIVIPGSIIGKNTNGTARTVDSYVNGLDGVGAKYGATTTGYYLRKMLCENFDLTKTDAKPKAWVLMRYAEVLLSFAEAMNEAYGPDAKPAYAGLTFTMSAREAINLVRARSTMPALALGMSQADMRTRIRNERRVELCFEDHRFFDVRRWNIAIQTEVTPLMGMQVVKNTDGTFNYTTFIVEQRSFDPKMNLFPIPYSEVAKSNGVLVQNPGW